MNAKEAREIIKLHKKSDPLSWNREEQIGAAQGYLEAHEKAKGLVKAHRNIITSSIPDLNGRTFHIYNSEMKDFEKALAKWEEEG